MINRAVLVGRLTRDPERKNTQSTTPMATFTLAVNGYQKKDKEEENTLFITVVTFNKNAEFVLEYVKAKMIVGVDGRLTQRRFTRKDETKGSVIELTADSVQILEPKGNRAEEESSETPVFDDIQSESVSGNTDTTDVPDDDLPF